MQQQMWNLPTGMDGECNRSIHQYANPEFVLGQLPHQAAQGLMEQQLNWHVQHQHRRGICVDSEQSHQSRSQKPHPRGRTSCVREQAHRQERQNLRELLQATALPSARPEASAATPAPSIPKVTALPAGYHAPKQRVIQQNDLQELSGIVDQSAPCCNGATASQHRQFASSISEEASACVPGGEILKRRNFFKGPLFCKLLLSNALAGAIMGKHGTNHGEIELIPEGRIKLSAEGSFFRALWNAYALLVATQRA
mmetsp:Transcript_81052/g.160625  ORF Transcript_81052/g.160625 Transcript_81052/m.160625 type:complete len:254 (+) Transcript_81052:46-807(+)